MTDPIDSRPIRPEDDQEGMNQAMARAVRRALLVHKRARNPIAVLRDGEVVWIPPGEIPADDAPTSNM